MQKSERRPRVFVSYCHRNEKWLRMLLDVLQPSIGETTFEVWTDERIQPGKIWRDEIGTALADSSVAVLLVTQAYLNSGFVESTEFPQILEAATERGLRVLWVAAEPSTYRTTTIDRYQATNDPARPLLSLRGADRLNTLVEIANKVRDAVISSGLPATPSLKGSNPQLKDERWRQTIDICDYIRRYAPRRVDILQFSLMTLSTYEFWDTFSACRDVAFRILLLKPDLAEQYSLRKRQRRDVERTAEQIALIDGQLRHIPNRPTVGVWYYESLPTVAAVIADDDLVQLGWYFMRADPDDPRNLSVYGLESPGVLAIGNEAKRVLPKVRLHFESVLASIRDEPLVLGPETTSLVQEWRDLRSAARAARSMSTQGTAETGTGQPPVSED